MLNFIAATVCGFLAGLGVGGGSLLILWLTVILGIPHPEARIVNLMFFIPSAVIASVFRWKQGNLQIKKLLSAIVAGCVAAALFSLLSRQLDLAIIRRIFGGLLLITGIHELMYKPR